MDPEKRGYKFQEFVAHDSEVRSLAISKKSSHVFVTGGDDRKVNLWAIGKQTPLLSLSGHTSSVEAVEFDPAEVLVLAGSSNGSINIWDLEEAKVVRSLTGHRSSCTSVDFHPFGEFFASGSSDTDLKIWDIRKKGCIRTYKGHRGAIRTIKFTPDGRWIVTGGEDNIVKVWDLTAGKLLHDFKFHSGPIRCIDFHPQEFLLATGSADRTVKFWDLETFELIGSSGPEGTGVRSTVFHPDGKTLFCGLDQSLKVFSWEPVRCHAAVDMGWSNLADLSIYEGTLLGCSYHDCRVGVWVADISTVDNDLAFEIYIKAPATPKVVAAFDGKILEHPKQADKEYTKLQQVSALKGPGETSYKISSVSELADELRSMAVSVAPSKIPPAAPGHAEKAYELQPVRAPNGPQEISHEFYDDDGPSLSSSMSSGPPSEMVQASELEALEHILGNVSAEPTKLSYTVLQFITNNFCKVIGHGAFAVVYQGVLPNGRKVAVKKLLVPHNFSDEVFVDEINCLRRAKHSNIVRFLGYCATTQGALMEFNGSCVMADVRKRLLCFEYVPNGSLHRYLKGKSREDEWQIRYQMIKGICRGLHYLHETRINHLDLKPGNILLDVHMEPKITDFGLSRCFEEGQTIIFTKGIRGTPGYIAPEIINNGEISLKSDIFALGIIIIKLLMGRNNYDSENWHESLNMDCPRVKCCAEIAQACLNDDQHKRPAIGEIMHKLNELDTTIQEESPVIQ